MQYAARSRVSHAGHNDADTLASGDGPVVLKNNFDLLAQIRNQPGQVSISREVGNADQWLAKEICSHDISTRRSYIHGNDVALSRVDVEKGRFPASPTTFSSCAFEDQTLRQ